MTSTIDVVIPCYRYGHFLRECVESVLEQVGVAVRILILDDASPDNTADVGGELASIHDNVEFRRHVVNKGHIATYNEGIEWAKSEYFLLLSADDFLLPGALSRAAKLMDAVPSISFVFGNALLTFEDGRSVPLRPLGKGVSKEAVILSCRDFVKAMNGANIVPTPTAIVRTRTQKHVGGYSAELPHAGDMAMWLKLAGEGQVGYVNVSQAVYRMHSLNMSQTYSSLRLPDFHQRKAAIDHFCRHLPETIPLREAKRMRRTLLRGLGLDAVMHAGNAFDDGDIELSYQLSDLAQTLHPSVGFSGERLKLLLHRTMGMKAWSILRQARNACR